MRRRTSRTTLYGILFAAALLSGSNAVSIVVTAAEGDAKGTADKLRRWADRCTQNSNDCAGKLYRQEYPPDQPPAPPEEASQWKAHCRQDFDDCAIRLYQLENPPPNAAADGPNRKDYCARYPGDCGVRLYKYEHRRLSTAAPHILMQWADYCSRNPGSCTNQLNEYEPNSAGQQNCTTSNACPAPLPREAIGCPLEPCPGYGGEPASPPSQSVVPPAPIRDDPPANQFGNIGGLALILIGLILLLLVWRFVPNVRIGWKLMMPSPNPTEVNIAELQKSVRELKAERVAQKTEMQKQLDEFKRSLLAEVRAEFEKWRNESRSSAQPRGVGNLASDPAERRAYDRSHGLDGTGLHSPEDLRREYDRAIRERNTAKDFTDNWRVVGLIKVEGTSADGYAILAKSTEADPEKWPFWAVKADKGITAVLPGRYQFLHASALGADGGEVGNERIGQVFEIVDGADFNLRQLAKARETDGGFEICEKGQLELPRSRG